MKTKIIIILIIGLVLIWGYNLLAQESRDWQTLFRDDFEVGEVADWLLETGWKVEREEGNHVLSGIEHYWVRLALPKSRQWTNYSFKTRVKLLEGSAHLNYRVIDNGRYFIGFNEGGGYLHREIPWGTFYELASYQERHNYNTWYNVEIKGNGGNIKVYINGVLKIDYTDQNPIYFGSIAFETHENSHVHFDDVEITGPPPPASLSGYKWIRTGGPSGGLGYDVRIYPLDKNIMFVTDNPSGVNKSYDTGTTWVPRNKGIKTRSGPSLDGIPNFALTIDLNNPDIVWAGMQFARGVYKSTDRGETWVKKDNGILEGNDLSVRNFGIRPGNSNIVFLGAEVMRGELGKEFDKTAGVIYKTEDGGENWRRVWEGDNLARFVLFDYHNPDIMYASTGIFDREARNDIGVGILKSTDGGENWFEINNGIPNEKGNRFCGFLEMHPKDPKILYTACGNNARGPGGIFQTKNGGESWKKVLNTGEIFTVVVVSPSNTNIIYAGNELAFYRSEDGGSSWKKFWKKEVWNWGPPGIRAGFPISAVVDPNNPYIIFANNYSGGNFKSINGAETWTNSSTGYTGAHMHEVAIDPDNPAIVYTTARSGPFRSLNGGENWKGLAFSPLGLAEWNTIAINPSNSKEILLADEFGGFIFKSINGGNTWKTVFRHPQATQKNPQEDRHGFKAIAYALSDPKIVYAGMRKCRRTIDGDFPPRPSLGMYKSIDGGENWFEINNGLKTPLININAITIHPTNSNIVYIGTWQDGIFKTTDGGKSWQKINNGLTSLDIRSVAIDPKNPDIIYTGLSQGAGIFKSANGGKLWVAASNGLNLVCPSDLLPVGRTILGVLLAKPEIRRVIGQDYYSVPWTSIWSIVVDPTNSQTIYAGDHQSGVYVSFDGANTWHPINENLSTKAVTDLTISADGKVVYAATEGEGVFRIGKVEPVAWSEPKLEPKKEVEKITEEIKETEEEIIKPIEEITEPEEEIEKLPKNIFQKIWETTTNFFKRIFRI